MTAEETAQVNAYINDLQTKHNKALAFEQKSRKFAQEDSLKMGQAVGEIMKLSNTQPPLPAEQFAVCVRQIVNYFCPDYDIPF